MRIKNNSDENVTITFGCEGGLLNNELVMSLGNSLDTLIVDDIMLAYTYTGDNVPEKFPAEGEGYYIDDLTCSGGTAIWDNDTWTMIVTGTTGKYLNCNATIVDQYRDNSGASVPVIKGDLVPVIIGDTGSVIKANLKNEWYNYDESIWANAVILNDGYGPYSDGMVIPEEAIESYFVWIPRYKYKIFNIGSYTSVTSQTSAEQEIEIVFENKNIEPSTGSTVGTWLTHPAFTSFDSKGFWVAKFESGYKGATSSNDAKQDVSDVSKLVIKPNQFTWHEVTLGNAFKTSYEYQRNLDSHVMKNTEWGALAYLSHSKYGNVGNIRINNRIGNVTGYSAVYEPTIGSATSSTDGNRFEEPEVGTDGTYTLNYFNPLSVKSSTTGNYSGIYDTSGSSWEYVMGYSQRSTIGLGGVSGIDVYYSDFFTNNKYNKYYDVYNSGTNVDYNNRILGDATGEMGPFFSIVDPDDETRFKSSWYNDIGKFAHDTMPWFVRGGTWIQGNSSGIFAFSPANGGIYTAITFRVALTPVP